MLCPQMVKDLHEAWVITYKLYIEMAVLSVKTISSILTTSVPKTLMLK